MLSLLIPPQSDKALNCYHQKLSWKISEENLKSLGVVFLELSTKIPGSSSRLPPNPVNPGLTRCLSGGFVGLTKNGIYFVTRWPMDVDKDKISLEASISIKVDDESPINIVCDKTLRKEHGHGVYHTVSIEKVVNIDPEFLYDKERFITIEAELKVIRLETNSEEISKKLNEFNIVMETMFHDSKTSDVVVIAGNEKFLCHKVILSARCEVFKNMLAHNTIESELNTIEVKEVPAEAVETVLKYIYTWEVPEDPAKLTFDLLQIAEMYLLDDLKEACWKSLVDRLEVPSCISTFILADRYNPGGGKLKEVVIKYIKCKAEEVVELEDWDKFFDNHPALANELMKALVKGSKVTHKCQFCVLSYDK